MPNSRWASAIERAATSTVRVGAQPAGEIEAVRIHVGDDNIPGAGVANHRGRHNPDRPRARDQHVLAQYGKVQRRVHRVAEGVEDRLDVARQGRVVDPDVGHGQGKILGVGPRPVDADRLGVLAEVAAAGKAVAAPPTDHVPLAADDLAGPEVLHVAADVDDAADEFMADDQGDGNRLLRPGVPGVDVHVGAANPGAEDFNQHVVDAHLWLGHVLQP